KHQSLQSPSAALQGPDSVRATGEAWRWALGGQECDDPWTQLVAFGVGRLGVGSCHCDNGRAGVERTASGCGKDRDLDLVDCRSVANEERARPEHDAAIELRLTGADGAAVSLQQAHR